MLGSWQVARSMTQLGSAIQIITSIGINFLWLQGLGETMEKLSNNGNSSLHFAMP